MAKIDINHNYAASEYAAAAAKDQSVQAFLRLYRVREDAVPSLELLLAIAHLEGQNYRLMLEEKELREHMEHKIEPQSARPEGE